MAQNEAPARMDRMPPRSSAVILNWRPPELLRLLAVLWQRWWFIAAMLIAGLAASVGYAMYTGPSYEVGAQIMLQYGPELTPPATASTRADQQPPAPLKRIEDATAEVQILKDPNISLDVVNSLGEDFFYTETEPKTFFQAMKRAVRSVIKSAKILVEETVIALGLRPRLSRLEKAALLVQSEIDIQLINRSEVIELKMFYPERELGVAVLQRYIDAYLARREKVFRNRRIGNFFDTEAKAIKEELNTQEAELIAIRETGGGWRIDTQQQQLVERRNNLLSDKANIDVQMASLRAQLDALNAKIESLPQTIVSSVTNEPNPLLDSLNLRRIELKSQLGSMLRRFGGTAAETEEIKRQLEELDQAIAEAPIMRISVQVVTTNATRDALEREVIGVEQQMISLSGKIEEEDKAIHAVETELKRQENLGLVLRNKEREVDRLRKRYDLYLAGVDQSRIAGEVAAASIFNVSIIAAPSAGLLPASPKLMRLLLVGALLGLAGAIGLLLSFEAVWPRIRSDSDIEDKLPGVIVTSVPNVGV